MYFGRVDETLRLLIQVIRWLHFGIDAQIVAVLQDSLKMDDGIVLHTRKILCNGNAKMIKLT